MSTFTTTLAKFPCNFQKILEIGVTLLTKYVSFLWTANMLTMNFSCNFMLKKTWQNANCSKNGLTISIIKGSHLLLLVVYLEGILTQEMKCCCKVYLLTIDYVQSLLDLILSTLECKVHNMCFRYTVKCQ